MNSFSHILFIVYDSCKIFWLSSILIKYSLDSMLLEFNTITLGFANKLTSWDNSWSSWHSCTKERKCIEPDKSAHTFKKYCLVNLSSVKKDIPSSVKDLVKMLKNGYRV